MVDVVDRVRSSRVWSSWRVNTSATLGPSWFPATLEAIELGDVTLLPGLMDMELNFLMGVPAPRT